MDLSKYSLAELRELQNAVLAEMKKREQDELRNAREQIYVIAAAAKIDLRDMIAGSGKSKKAASVAAKYRDPADEKNKWTGRGRQPKWVKDALAAGKSLQDLAI